MPKLNDRGQMVPDYKLVDNLRIGSAFSDQAVRDAINHKPNPGDIFLATFPKCGTTWTQQILLLLLNDAKPFVDAKEFLMKCPYLEYTGIDALEGLAEPRLAKIHLPFNLTPFSPEAKYIFINRNPKDCLMSFYHHTRTAMYDFVEGEFDVYFELFMNSQIDYNDYFDHILSWYEHRNDSNVLYLHYENMKKDIRSNIIKIATFLGPKYKELVADPEKLADIIHYSSFEYMKLHVNEDLGDLFDVCMNPNTNIDDLPLPSGMKFSMKYLKSKNTKSISDLKLVRKGIVGDGKANFTEDQNRRMNEKIQQKMKGTEILEFWNQIGCI